jgi:hypothetical protein
MEKIALKNTQVGGANTYELAYDIPRQLIASYSKFDEIKENESAVLNITSQDRILQSQMPLEIIVLNIVLYFAEANNQNMQLNITGASVSLNFSAPSSGQNVILDLENNRFNQNDSLRMDVENIETTQILPQPILRGWCLTYIIPAP